ncbi:MAG: hypothetical protein J6M02_07020 [Clostridia bacterium]|nr:hypothetical protein [Clostridia bacterium]
MNIDFSKLKNMDLKDINLKDLKNRKELLILLGIVIFIVAIFLIGNGLWKENVEASSELKRLKAKYEEILRKENSVEVLSQQIEEMNTEILASETAILPIDEAEIINILEDMQDKVGIRWDKKNRVISEATEVPEVKGILKFKVTTSSFTATYEQTKKLMEYIDHLGSRVSLESYTLGKNSLTGELRGTMVLNFYMAKDEA